MAGYDLESAWSFESVTLEAAVILSEDLRMGADPQLFRPSGRELPWESEVARGIFGDPARSYLACLVLGLGSGIDSQVEQELDVAGAVFLKAIRHKADSMVHEERQKAWGTAVSKWARIIMQYPAISTLGA